MLPKQTPIPKNRPLALMGFVVLLLYTFQNFIPGITSIPRIYGYALVFLLFVVSVALFFKDWKRDLPMFFRHFKDYCAWFFPKFAVFLLVYFTVAITVAVIAGQPAANQSLLMNVSLKRLAFLSLLYAPLQEEMIFRGFLRRLVDDNTFFVLVSALVFGGIHMLHPDQTPEQFLYIINYALIGGFFAHIYTKTDNIMLPVMGHFSVNLIAFLSMVLFG